MMASNGRFFLAGVGTTLLILACSFGGGVMLARTGSEPSTRQMAAAALPSVRVTAQPGREQVQPTANPETSVASAIYEGPTAAEGNKRAKLTEHRTVERRHLRNKIAERKARREATRVAAEEQRTPQATILASGLDDDQRSRPGGFFGN